jgi:endonuclease III
MKGAARKPAAGTRRLERKPRVRKPDPAHAGMLYDALAATYPDAHCALNHRNAFELLVATILSAQCTDKRVNMVTPVLFERYPDPHALAAAKQEDVEELIRSTGFFRNKATNIIAMATALVERYGGEVPCSMEALVQLPGVGRKTANVVLGNAFSLNEGIVVDTHVARLSRRLGLTALDDPVKIEEALIPLFPRERWTMLSHLLIEHGRQVCDAKKPRCGACMLRPHCPSALPPDAG